MWMTHRTMPGIQLVYKSSYLIWISYQKSCNIYLEVITLFVLNLLNLGCSLSKRQEKNVGVGLEKRGPLYIVGGNVHWNSHYGKHYEGSSKREKRRYHLIQQSSIWKVHISKGNEIIILKIYLYSYVHSNSGQAGNNLSIPWQMHG